MCSEWYPRSQGNLMNHILVIIMFFVAEGLIASLPVGKTCQPISKGGLVSNQSVDTVEVLNPVARIRFGIVHGQG